MSLKDNARVFVTTTEYHDFVKISGPTNGQTVRVGTLLSNPGKLTVSNLGTSSENGTVPTDRSNVRIAVSKEIGDTGKFVQGYVQFTMSIPKGFFTDTETAAMAAGLLNYLQDSALEAETEMAGAVLGTSMATVRRLYVGES